MSAFSASSWGYAASWSGSGSSALPFPPSPMSIFSRPIYSPSMPRCLSSFLYLFDIFPEESPRTLRMILVIPGILFSLLVLVTPARIYHHSIDWSNFIMVASGLCMIWIAGRAVWKKRDGSVIFVAGLIIALVTVGNDILRTMYLVQTANIASFGFLLFTMNQAYMLSLRFSRSHDQAETLTHQLEAFSRSLEFRVDERTEELAEEKKRLALRNRELERSEKRFRDLVEVLPTGGTSSNASKKKPPGPAGRGGPSPLRWPIVIISSRSTTPADMNAETWCCRGSRRP
ncbi:MAG TPA: 7TM-DISM domain-containing protein [Spirochaetota bacterium]|nr:7TM-DISM domain-containing protein [Spirochaetota bacterium]HQF09463.1 7TM-DISM domain-containing protein [Spirochaetota bacterium]HQH98146.1 7TM-DISM domain-containing protein [Spirochaetota bacterium]HQJ72324.1 7TM-DISM domain-containing protein [Spirochaetota bacterium]HRS76212.1 7TM-DISM domain-containing protein [Spirochaetota bacterium]